MNALEASKKYLSKTTIKEVDRLLNGLFQDNDNNPASKQYNQFILHLLCYDEIRLQLSLLTTEKQKEEPTTLSDRIAHYFAGLPIKYHRLILFFFRRESTINTQSSYFDSFFKQSAIIRYAIEKIRAYKVVSDAVLENLKESRLVKNGPGIKYLAPCNVAAVSSSIVIALVFCAFTGTITNILTSYSTSIVSYFTTHTFLALFSSGLLALGLPAITGLLSLLIYYAVLKSCCFFEGSIRAQCRNTLDEKATVDTNCANYLKVRDFTLPALTEAYIQLAKNMAPSQDKKMALEPLK